MTVIGFIDMIDCPSLDALMVQMDEKKSHELQALRNDWMYSLRNMPAQNFPQIFHTLGFSASGKTTLLEHLHLQGAFFPQDVFFLGFDRVMESCEAYQQDLAELGQEKAFAQWEMPARALGYELLQEALNRKIHIVFEHSGSRQDHVNLLRYMKYETGYKVTMIDVLCDPDLAMARSLLRQRHLPSEYIVERKKIIDRLRPLYRALADEWYGFDMNGALPQRVE